MRNSRNKKSLISKFSQARACGKPIKHKVYAHVEKIPIGKASELFGKTNNSEMRFIIEFKYQVEMA